MSPRARDAARRPVTFAFNGGPGAASIYLNLGLAGPRIVDFGPDGRDGAAAKLVDNPDSWLAFTDLVMIDPIGTGWSRTAKPDGGKAFWGVRSDADVFAKVIALYVAKNSRGASPKYLLGESYGGFRAAKVARALQSDQGIVVTGIVMVSPMLEASFQWGGSQYALGAALQFPDAGRDRARTDQEIHAGGAGRGRALRDDRISDDARRPAADRRQGQGVLRADRRDDRAAGRRRRQGARLRSQRLSPAPARQRPDRQQLRRDLRRRPIPIPKAQARRGGDPMLDGFTRALSGAFVGYARDELGFKTDMTYILLAHDVGVEVGMGRPARAAGRQRRSARHCSRSTRRSGCWSRMAAPTW